MLLFISQLRCYNKVFFTIICTDKRQGRKEQQPINLVSICNYPLDMTAWFLRCRQATTRRPGMLRVVVSPSPCQDAYGASGARRPPGRPKASWRMRRMPYMGSMGEIERGSRKLRGRGKSGEKWRDGPKSGGNRAAKPAQS